MSEGSSGPAWGRVDQAVMRDPALSIEAKGIYAYLCAFADESGKCYPGISTILTEIGMSKTRYYKYLDELKKCKLIRVEVGQRTKGSFPRNTYYIMQPCPNFKETSPLLQSEETPPLPNFKETSQNKETSFPQNRETAVSSNCNKPFPQNKETNTSVINTSDNNTSNKNKINNSQSGKDAAIATIREILNSRRWRQCLQTKGGYTYLHKPSSMTWDNVIAAAYEYIAQYPEPTQQSQNDWIQWYSFSDFLETKRT